MKGQVVLVQLLVAAAAVFPTLPEALDLLPQGGKLLLLQF
jgi:hypothetical protein